MPLETRNYPHILFPGFIFGVWNSHTSLGNILGTTLASYYIERDWGMSFIMPGLVMGICGLIIFAFLAPHPSNVGCGQPTHLQVSWTSVNYNYISDCTKGGFNMEVQIAETFFPESTFSGLE